LGDFDRAVRSEVFTFEVATFSESFGARGQDRVDAVEHPGGRVVILADGAGGTSGGAEAADTVLLWVKSYLTRTTDIRGASQWGELLCKVDRQVSFVKGQTTAVVVSLFDDGVAGASVGDSAAWLVDDTSGYVDLTVHQIRKPLLGTGGARPVVFEHSGMSGTLLVASDGLFNYARHDTICEIARRADLKRAATCLAEAVRLKSGALQDDIAVAICRKVLARY